MRLSFSHNRPCIGQLIIRDLAGCSLQSACCPGSEAWFPKPYGNCSDFPAHHFHSCPFPNVETETPLFSKAKSSCKLLSLNSHITSWFSFNSSSMRMPKLSVTSSLDFDERDEEELFEPAKNRRSGNGMPLPRPFPSPTQPPANVCGSLPATPSFAGKSVLFA